MTTLRHAIVRDNILFKDLDERLVEELVVAVFPAAFPANHVIIKQGDEGENFYIVVGLYELNPVYLLLDSTWFQPLNL